MKRNLEGKGKMNPDSGPVIEDDSLPTMAEVDDADLAVTETPTSKWNVMSEPAPSNDVDDSGALYPDMQTVNGDGAPPANAADFEATLHGDAYIKLVVNVDQGEMSVRSASVVGGPLVEPELTGQMVYEVLLHGRRIAAGAFDDLSWQHGFAPDDDEQRGHSHTELTKYDFVVRIPREDVTLAELADLEIRLERPETTTQLSVDVQPRPGTPFASAAADAGVAEPDVVARLSGVDIGHLPKRSAEALRGKLR